MAAAASLAEGLANATNAAEASMSAAAVARMAFELMNSRLMAQMQSQKYRDIAGNA